MMEQDILEPEDEYGMKDAVKNKKIFLWWGNWKWTKTEFFTMMEWDISEPGDGSMVQLMRKNYLG